MLGKIAVPEVLIALAVLCVLAFISGKVLSLAARTVARVVYVAFAVLFAVWLWNWATPLVAIP